ncbi:MAG TPA: di-heme oxidoredictase family protein [Myxococcota bacterium]|nr:di-heme oxidoredictase family protein [Myxococcota bacterium]
MWRALASTALALTACFPGAPDDSTLLDGPVDGLTQPELATFARGDTQFARRFSTTDGLGPTFVATSCDSCHPGDGRSHPELALVRFGRMLDGDVFDPMIAHGGPQLQSRAIPGQAAERVPDDATGVTRFIAPPVSGLGLVEAVPDDVLLALADPGDVDGDGISGRPQRLTPTPALADMFARDVALPDGVGTAAPYVGRFGRKASATSLLHQTLTAYVQDMGITTPFTGVSLLAGSEVLDAGFEIDAAELADVTIYLRTLKAPPRRNQSDARVRAGESLFADLGCSSCHVSSMTTGSSVIAALAGVTFAPYSDFLLHDMGPELDDGYTEGIATTSEWRTTPLWGLGLGAQSQGGEGFYLHDGSARSSAEAVAYHGGEGSAARSRFDGLSEDGRRALYAFLESL